MAFCGRWLSCRNNDANDVNDGIDRDHRVLTLHSQDDIDGKLKVGKTKRGSSLLPYGNFDGLWAVNHHSYLDGRCPKVRFSQKHAPNQFLLLFSILSAKYLALGHICDIIFLESLGVPVESTALLI